jgi:retinol dehydrogenase-12
MASPQGSKTKQGYEQQLGTNNIAPFLFTKLLTPLLRSTAATAPPGSVRVIWTSSSAAEAFSPPNGVDMANLDYKKDYSWNHKYGVSKAGNIFHSKEYARRYAGDGIVSVALNPGNLKSDLQRYLPGWQARLLDLMLYTPIHGAYTELFAGLSPEVKTDAWSEFMSPFFYFK